jgi:hypothetical protein
VVVDAWGEIFGDLPNIAARAQTSRPTSGVVAVRNASKGLSTELVRSAASSW